MPGERDTFEHIWRDFTPDCPADQAKYAEHLLHMKLNWLNRQVAQNRMHPMTAAKERHLIRSIYHSIKAMAGQPLVPQPNKQQLPEPAAEASA